MKSLIAVAACCLFLAGPSLGQGSEPAPCALMTKAEVAAIFGELKGEPKPRHRPVGREAMRLRKHEGKLAQAFGLSVGPLGNAEIHGERNESGKYFRVGRRSIRGQTRDRRRSDHAQGEWILEVRSNSGRAITQKVAELAVKKMP